MRTCHRMAPHLGVCLAARECREVLVQVLQAPAGQRPDCSVATLLLLQNRRMVA